MTIDIDAIRRRAELATATRQAWANETGVRDVNAIAGMRRAKELVVDDVPALLAKVDELTAERDAAQRESGDMAGELSKAWDALNRAGFQSPVDGVAELIDQLSAALTQSRQQTATYANEIGALKADLERTRADLAKADIVIASMRAAIDEDEAVAR